MKHLGTPIKNDLCIVLVRVWYIRYENPRLTYFTAVANCFMKSCLSEFMSCFNIRKIKRGN